MIVASLFPLTHREIRARPAPTPSFSGAFKPHSVRVTHSCVSLIQKCLAAGYNRVIVLSPERKTLSPLRELVESNLGGEEIKKLFFLVPEEFVSFLETTEAATAGTEQKVRGYRVKVNYRPLKKDEKTARKEAIAKTILQAVKRLKKEE